MPNDTRRKILIIIGLAGTILCAQEVDERPMRAALIQWHEFYHAERHKCETNNPAVGLALAPSLDFVANTRSMQLDYFDRKVCRQFAAISNAETASNFVTKVKQWTTTPLPEHP